MINLQNIEKEESLRDIFMNLSYGPAPESDDVAKAWLKEHDGKFGHFINNRWIIPEGRESYRTLNPSTGEYLAATTQGTQKDVNMAVDAANKAYITWSKTSGHYRAKILYSIARHVQKHSRLISVIECIDNGKSIRETRDSDINVVIRHLYHHAGWAQLKEQEMKGWTSLGVVGAIVPWNFPLMLLLWKVCPALAMGNTVVVKPATYTRLSALLFAEICKEAGLPDGVFNVVTGSGEMGSLLASHPDVSKVAFTGSTEIGQVLRKLTAGSGKKLSLELGGKSPVIVFDNADIDSAVEGVVDAIWFNQGQVCSAGSRLLVQETIFDEVISKLKVRMSHLRLGKSMDKVIDMAAIIDPNHLKTIEEMVEEARKEGAEVFQSCAIKPDGGCFYPPTLITNIQTVSKIVIEEIFGPVLVAMPFRTSLEACQLANNTCYGLGAGVWTEKLSLALEVALKIKAGTVWVNCHNLFDSAAGFGGYRMSGYGRDGGKEGLYEYVKRFWQPSISDLPSLKPDFDYKTFGLTANSANPIISDAVANNLNLKEGKQELDSELKIDRTYKFYYGGSQQRPDAPYSRPITSVDGKIIGHVGEANRKDVRNCVEAAHKAADGWGKRAAHNRAQILYYIAENLEQQSNEYIELILNLTSCSKTDAQREVSASIDRLFHWAAYTDKNGGTVQETTLYGATVQINEPVGVVGIICPDEWPLLAFISLFAPAIARSNCVVVVPSEKYPLLALSMYQIFDTSDLPGGVVNIITGSRNHLTKHLSEHRQVQSIWFMGVDREASKYVEYASAGNVKRTWVDYGVKRDWIDEEQGTGPEFLYHANQVKNIWLPMGETFSN